MIQTLVKFVISLAAISAIILTLVYYSGLIAGAVGATVFIIGWLNGVGDSLVQL